MHFSALEVLIEHDDSLIINCFYDARSWASAWIAGHTVAAYVASLQRAGPAS